MKKGFVVAIDGPVASGKGTIAHKLAQLLNAVNFNTGGVWRAYTYLLMEKGMSSSKDIVSYLQTEEVSMEVHDHGSFDVLLNGQNVTQKLNDPEISRAVSKFGLMPDFAKFVISQSREMAIEYLHEGKSVIMEGRQIGTVIFPDAQVRLFLTADVTIRAQRRYSQYIQKGIDKPLDEVIAETKQRDEDDMNREFGALSKDPKKDKYTIIDNSSLSEEETIQQILDILRQKKLWLKN